MKIKNKSPCSLFYVSLISLPLCCRRSGICRGTGAAHGPSAQYVQAGAEWRRCNSGKKMEILRFWHTEFSVTQEWRTHTLRRHTNVNRRAQCLGPLIHMCVCACSSDTRQCSRQQMTFTQADTGNCESDGFFFFRIPKDISPLDAGFRWNNISFPHCRLSPRWTATGRYRLSSVSAEDTPSVCPLKWIMVLGVLLSVQFGVWKIQQQPKHHRQRVLKKFIPKLNVKRFDAKPHFPGR